ncbi:MAG: Maf family protein [Promethearchaeota archaeon]
MKKIILASKSSDRKDIFERSGIQFEVLVTNVNEEKFKEKIFDPISLAKELAGAKVSYAKEELIKRGTPAIIVAADTIVELDGSIIGKARNENEAFKMLKSLVGKTHNLITGIAITETYNSKIIIDHDITIVEFLNLIDEEIDSYIMTGEWKGRAGGYSINDKASLFITKINGSSSNVIGFPMHKLYLILKNEFSTNLFH